MWFLLELPLNFHRIGLMHNPRYFSNGVLYTLALFLIKIDMFFGEPMQAPHSTLETTATGLAHRFPTGTVLRSLLLEHSSLTPLWRVLRGWSWDPRMPRTPMNFLETFKLWVRCIYRTHPGHHSSMWPACGVPWWEIGTAMWERSSRALFQMPGGITQMTTHPALGLQFHHGATTVLAAQLRHLHHQIAFAHSTTLPPAHLTQMPSLPRQRLMRPDYLVLIESVQRNLGMAERFEEMMVWGVSNELGCNIPLLSERYWLSVLRGRYSWYRVLYKTMMEVQNGAEDPEAEGRQQQAIGANA